MLMLVHDAPSDTHFAQSPSGCLKLEPSIFCRPSAGRTSQAVRRLRWPGPAAGTAAAQLGKLGTLLRPKRSRPDVESSTQPAKKPMPIMSFFTIKPAAAAVAAVAVAAAPVRT